MEPENEFVQKFPKQSPEQIWTKEDQEKYMEEHYFPSFPTSKGVLKLFKDGEQIDLSGKSYGEVAELMRGCDQIIIEASKLQKGEWFLLPMPCPIHPTQLKNPNLKDIICKFELG